MEPLNANAKEKEQFNSFKKIESVNFNKEFISKIFKISMQNLALNVNNLAITPLPNLNLNYFCFSKEENFEFFNLLNAANNLAFMVKSLTNSYNSDVENMYKLLNLCKLYGSIRY